MQTFHPLEVAALGDRASAPDPGHPTAALDIISMGEPLEQDVERLYAELETTTFNPRARKPVHR